MMILTNDKYWTINRSFKKHLNTFLMAGLTYHPRDPIIVVESYFRPLVFRIAEYVYFALMRTFHVARADSITLGLNQLSVRYWYLFFLSEGIRPNVFQFIAYCENVFYCRAATEFFFQRINALASHHQISTQYTGAHNAYYDYMIKHTDNLLRAQRNLHSQKMFVRED